MIKNKLVLFLGISVLLNAFLAGFLISSCHDGPRPPFMNDKKFGHKQGRDMMSEIISRQSAKLSPEGQKIVAKIVEANKAHLSAPPDRMNNGIFEELKTAMVAKSFDKEKVDALHAKLHSSELEFKQGIATTMTEIAVSLKDEDRIAFFEGLLPPGPPPHGEGPEPDGRRDDRPDFPSGPPKD